jgi:transcriptional regulator with XRE-family HTH domain
VAAAAGISSGALGKLERGRSDPTLGTLLCLMRALEIDSLEAFLGELPSASLQRLARRDDE